MTCSSGSHESLSAAHYSEKLMFESILHESDSFSSSSSSSSSLDSFSTFRLLSLKSNFLLQFLAHGGKRGFNLVCPALVPSPRLLKKSTVRQYDPFFILPVLTGKVFLLIGTPMTGCFGVFIPVETGADFLCGFSESQLGRWRCFPSSLSYMWRGMYTPSW